MDDRYIRIQNLTDYHMNDFLTCPLTFWRKHIEKKSKEQVSDQDLFDHAVKGVVRDYFSLPVEARSADKIHHLIWNRRNKDQVLAPLTNHLSPSLLNDRDQQPLFLYEKMSVSVPEWEIQLTMTVPLAFWTGDSFTIKKFVLHENPEFTRSWSFFCIFFCRQAFGRIPTKLELISLSTGSSTTMVPTEADIFHSKDYLELLKESMKDPSMYFNHYPKLAQ